MKIMSDISRKPDFMADHVCTSCNATTNAFSMVALPILILRREWYFLFALVQPEKGAMYVGLGLKCLMLIFLMQSAAVLQLWGHQHRVLLTKGGQFPKSCSHCSFDCTHLISLIFVKETVCLKCHFELCWQWRWSIGVSAIDKLFLSRISYV
jgi:hypothetical protein